MFLLPICISIIPVLFPSAIFVFHIFSYITAYVSGFRCFVRRVYWPWPTLSLTKVRISLQLLQLVDTGSWLKWFVECTPAQTVYGRAPWRPRFDPRLYVGFVFDKVAL
jgi:hypothetical protein